jgi:hypothetical protein
MSSQLFRCGECSNARASPFSLIFEYQHLNESFDIEKTFSEDGYI